MNDTDRHIVALAKAARQMGEPGVTAQIAGQIVTVHAAHPVPETAPPDHAHLFRQIAIGRGRVCAHPPHGPN